METVSRFLANTYQNTGEARLQIDECSMHLTEESSVIETSPKFKASNPNSVETFLYMCDLAERLGFYLIPMNEEGMEELEDGTIRHWLVGPFGEDPFAENEEEEVFQAS